MASHDAVTYLLIDDIPNREAAIAGFYCLSAGEVRREAAPASVAKHAPEPIPVIRMGRFAIDLGYQARGLGAQLLRESLTSALAAANLIGSRAMLVDAVNDTAKAFYQRYGFIESPIHPMQLLISLRVIAKSTGI